MPCHDDPTTSSTLLAKLAAVPTDQMAWSRFVDRYGPRILAWCRTRGLQDADARDLSQIVLAKLHTRMRHFRYDPSRTFRGYLRAVVVGTLKDTAGARDRVVSAGTEEVQALLGSLEARNELANRLEAEFDMELLEIAKRSVQKRVEPQTWEAYRLTAEEGLAGAEVAARLGIPVANVFVFKGRVLKMLQQEISTHDSGRIDEDQG
jgi:RNA polymerase sigma-70 factor (ECF subfamily)